MRGLLKQFHLVAGFIRALITAPFVPEAGVLPQIIPFAAVSHRHRMADVAAERLAVGIMKGTFQPAINGCDWAVETIIQAAKINGGFAGHKRILPDVKKLTL